MKKAILFPGSPRPATLLVSGAVILLLVSHTRFSFVLDLDFLLS
jgi:hypothetical protein